MLLLHSWDLPPLVMAAALARPFIRCLPALHLAQLQQAHSCEVVTPAGSACRVPCVSPARFGRCSCLPSALLLRLSCYVLGVPAGIV